MVCRDVLAIQLKSDRMYRHEHLYGKEICANVIESSTLPNDTVSTSRLLLGCKVILYTLSMLSNTKLGVFTRLAPIELVVVDEASQIGIGDYLSPNDFPLSNASKDCLYQR